MARHYFVASGWGVLVNPGMIRLSITALVFLLCLPAGRATDAPTVLFLIGEHEYGTGETLPAFAKAELEPRGVKSLFVTAKSNDRQSRDCHLFPGFREALAQADVLFLSVRRRYPLPDDMAAIRAWIKAGKPVVGIRTSSHPFGERPKGKGYQAPKGHEAWNTFDQDVLGIAYTGHYGSRSGHQVIARVADGAAKAPILKGVKVPRSAVVPSHLYISQVTNPAVRVLLRASIREEKADEPVAWTLEREGQRVFYTSVGGVDDMKLDWVQRLLVNAIYWSVDQKPALKQAAALGDWKLSVTDQEGVVHHPRIRLRREDGKLAGVYTAASDGQDYDPTGLKITGNRLTFTAESSAWRVVYRTTIKGDSLTGKMEYDIGGVTGETEITGVREK